MLKIPDEFEVRIDATGTLYVHHNGYLLLRTRRWDQVRFNCFDNLRASYGWKTAGSPACADQAPENPARHRELLVEKPEQTNTDGRIVA